MSNCRPKQLKFAGEDSFIVAKPGTKKFLMAIAEESSGLGKANIVNAEVLPLDNQGVTNPIDMGAADVIQAPAPMMIEVPDWESLSCAQILNEIESIRNILMTSKFPSSVYEAYLNSIAKGELVYASKCTKETPIEIPPSELPPAPPLYSEPDWASMNCEQIKKEVDNIQSILSSTTSEEQRQILVLSMKNGTKALERCNVSETPIEPIKIEPTPKDTNLIPEPTPKESNLIPEPTPTPTPTPILTTTPVDSGGGTIGAPPITTITTTGTPIIATATAGGLTSGAMPRSLGGGGGASGGAKEQVAKKKGFNLWWLVAGAAVLYLLTRDKK